MSSNQNKIALITGSNKGIGFETARQLALKGNHVIIASRSLEKAQAAANKLLEKGLKAEALELDVTNEASIQQAAEVVEKKYGKLDILINNAGVFPEFAQGAMDISKLTSSIWLQTHTTNTLGPLLMIKYFLPLLKLAPAARIVNVSSTAGSLSDQSNPNSPFYGVTSIAYNASKASLNFITIQIAKQLAGTNVRINSICPGWVRTDMGSDAAPRSVEQGAGIIIKMADLEQEVANGTFVDENGAIGW